MKRFTGFLSYRDPGTKTTEEGSEGQESGEAQGDGGGDESQD